MGIFSRKQTAKTSAPQVPRAAPWSPSIDLVNARSALLDLIYATNSQGRVSNDQIEQMVFRWGELSDTPTDPLVLMKRFQPDAFKDVLKRPWYWVAANAGEASRSGDHELVGICGFWVHMWRNLLQPKFGPYENQFWLVSSVPDQVRVEVRELAVASLNQLPHDHVLFGDETGQITAGWLADNLPLLLG